MKTEPAQATVPISPSNMSVLLGLVYFIYFFCGLTQCFESVLLPEIKDLFRLGYQQQMYTVFAKNIPFLASPWIGLAAARAGPRSCLAGAMVLYSLGAFSLAAALSIGSYFIVLASFFTIGLGFTVQMVAGNPLLRELGPAEFTSSRMNLGNALGAIAQILAPATLTVLIPASAVAVGARLPYMSRLFVALGIALGAIALAVALPSFAARTRVTPPFARRCTLMDISGRQILGFAVIFLSLGAEASLFVMFRNYVESRQIAGLLPHASERLLTLYFALFALGRLSGSWIQKRLPPEWNLLLYLSCAEACLAGVVVLRGAMALVAVTAVGFFVSILFPTLYAMFLDGKPEQVGISSGMLTMGFLGCAIVPVLQGHLADGIGLQRSYLPGLAIYALIGLVAALQIHRPRPVQA